MPKNRFSNRIEKPVHPVFSIPVHNPTVNAVHVGRYRISESCSRCPCWCLSRKHINELAGGLRRRSARRKPENRRPRGVEHVELGVAIFTIIAASSYHLAKLLNASAVVCSQTCCWQSSCLIFEIPQRPTLLGICIKICEVEECFLGCQC